MLPVHKMDIRFLFAEPVMIGKEKKFQQRIMLKELLMKGSQPVKKKVIQVMFAVGIVVP